MFDLLIKKQTWCFFLAIGLIAILMQKDTNQWTSTHVCWLSPYVSWINTLWPEGTSHTSKWTQTLSPIGSLYHQYTIRPLHLHLWWLNTPMVECWITMWSYLNINLSQCLVVLQWGRAKKTLYNWWSFGVLWRYQCSGNLMLWYRLCIDDDWRNSSMIDRSSTWAP